MKTNDNGIKKCLEEQGIDFRLIREFNGWRALSGGVGIFGRQPALLNADAIEMIECGMCGEMVDSADAEWDGTWVCPACIETAWDRRCATCACDWDAGGQNG